MCRGKMNGGREYGAHCMGLIESGVDCKGTR